MGGGGRWVALWGVWTCRHLCKSEIPFIKLNSLWHILGPFSATWVSRIANHDEKPSKLELQQVPITALYKEMRVVFSVLQIFRGKQHGWQILTWNVDFVFFSLQLTWCNRSKETVFLLGLMNTWNIRTWKHTHTYVYIYIHIYIYLFLCNQPRVAHPILMK